MKKLLYAVTSICLMTGIIFCNNVNTEAKVINNKIVYVKNNENGIAIKWDVVRNATKYVVYRTNQDGKFEEYDTVNYGNKYLDENVETGEEYRYVIYSYRYSKKIAESDESEKIVGDPKTVTNVTAKTGKGDEICITWDINPYASGYYVYKSSDNKNWDKIGTVYENEGKYIDKNTEYNILNNSTKLNAKLVYKYKVKAFENIDGRTYTSKISNSYGMAIQEKGIDVSHHNGKIDWKKIKKSGVDFAMIRIGYGDSKKGGIKDKKFKYNMKNAKANGVEIGVYFYSYADNIREAKKEAKYVIKKMKKYNIDYPIAYDFENDYRRKRKLKKKNTKIIDAFCKTVEDAGYNTVIYSDANYFRDFLYTKKLAKYGLWVARWTYDKNDFRDYDLENVFIWQYSDKGRIKGCDYPLDLNASFICKNDN